MPTVTMMTKAESESLSSYDDDSEVEDKHVNHNDNEVGIFYIFWS